MWFFFFFFFLSKSIFSPRRRDSRRVRTSFIPPQILTLRNECARKKTARLEFSSSVMKLARKYGAVWRIYVKLMLHNCKRNTAHIFAYFILNFQFIKAYIEVNCFIHLFFVCFPIFIVYLFFGKYFISFSYYILVVRITSANAGFRTNTKSAIRK